MGFFKDERIEVVETELVEVKKNVVGLECENKLIKDVVLSVKQSDVDKDIRINNLENNLNALSDRLQNVLDIINKEKTEQKEDKLIMLETSNMIDDGWFNYENLCKAADVGITQTELKYYLAENGILVKKINYDNNTFELPYDNINLYPEYIRNHCKIYKNKLLFDKWMIEFIRTHKNDIKKISCDMRRKAKEYKETKRKLESKNVKNYLSEIHRICGVNKEFNSKRWGIVFKEFKKKHTTFNKDIKEYIAENGEIRPFQYVVSVMGEGNYFLKITCELFA